MVIIEWVGPRWIRKTKSRSTSGRIEVASRSGKFSFTLASFDVAFPNMYPKARWPTANVQKTS